MTSSAFFANVFQMCSRHMPLLSIDTVFSATYGEIKTLQSGRPFDFYTFSTLLKISASTLSKTTFLEGISHFPENAEKSEFGQKVRISCSKSVPDDFSGSSRAPP